MDLGCVGVGAEGIPSDWLEYARMQMLKLVEDMVSRRKREILRKSRGFRHLCFNLFLIKIGEYLDYKGIAGMFRVDFLNMARLVWKLFWKGGSESDEEIMRVAKFLYGKRLKRMSWVDDELLEDVMRESIRVIKKMSKVIESIQDEYGKYHLGEDWKERVDEVFEGLRTIL